LTWKLIEEKGNTLSRNRRPRIGVFIGDPTGIGPEVTVKALSDKEVVEDSIFLIIGDERAFKQGQRIAGLTLEYDVVDKVEQDVLSNSELLFLDLKNMNPIDYRLGQLSPKMGKAVGDAMIHSIKLAMEGKIDAFVYAPINKQALNKGGFHYTSELSFFAHLIGLTEGYGEITALNGLWTSRVTSHIGIGEIVKYITRENVLKAILLAYSTLRKAKVENPKIGVSSLNPHGGEGGLFGPEEIDFITPAIKDAREMGIDAVGPYPSDTIFLRREKEQLDSIVSMYHDQGQIATKLLGFNRSVTVSGGLPFPITTASHGTAFDIAGKGLADPGTMKEAIKLASKMCKW
jgi:4-hydroxythreonine-4-phosphate dehydrogenase